MAQENSISARLTAGAASPLDETALIPSSYGQLVFLTRLLDADSGKYCFYDPQLDVVSGRRNASLKLQHERVFEVWVNASLQEKMADIELYIAGLPEVDRAGLIDAWLRLTPYKFLVPASIQGPERDKHISDFEAILGLLKNVYGVADPSGSA